MNALFVELSFVSVVISWGTSKTAYFNFVITWENMKIFYIVLLLLRIFCLFPTHKVKSTLVAQGKTPT